MRRILSTKYAAGGFNFSILIFRVAVGILIAHHGYEKLIRFSEMKGTFMNFLGLGSTFSLALVVFAEFFCSIFLMLGLFTRLAIIPIMIDMIVGLSKAHHGNIFGDGEKVAIYLACSIVILFCGPGRVSVDGMIGK
jgi:putative oxidoreductase